MHVPDNKPALILAVYSLISYSVHSAVQAVLPEVNIGHIETSFETVERWVHLIGGIGAALAGFASATWYLYSFIAARRKDHHPHHHHGHKKA